MYGRWQTKKNFFPTKFLNRDSFLMKNVLLRAIKLWKLDSSNCKLSLEIQDFFLFWWRLPGVGTLKIQSQEHYVWREGKWQVDIKKHKYGLTIINSIMKIVFKWKISQSETWPLQYTYLFQQANHINVYCGFEWKKNERKERKKNPLDFSL